MQVHKAKANSFEEKGLLLKSCYPLKTSSLSHKLPCWFLKIWCRSVVNPRYYFESPIQTKANCNKLSLENN